MFDALDNVSLEDSWFLDARLSLSSFAILMDVALLPGHPDYRTPGPGEAFCSRRGWLVFDGLAEFHLYRGIDEPTPDPDGTQDWGNLYVADLNGGRLRLESNYGVIILACERQPALVFSGAVPV